MAGRWPNGGSGRTGRPRRCRAGTCRRGSSRWQRSWCGAAVSLAVGEASGSRAEPREGGGAEAPNQATRGGACACGCVDTCVRSARRACRHRSLSEHVLAEPSPRAAQAEDRRHGVFCGRVVSRHPPERPALTDRDAGADARCRTWRQHRSRRASCYAASRHSLGAISSLVGVPRRLLTVGTGP